MAFAAAAIPILHITVSAPGNSYGEWPGLGSALPISEPPRPYLENYVPLGSVFVCFVNSFLTWIVDPGIRDRPLAVVSQEAGHLPETHLGQDTQRALDNEATS